MMKELVILFSFFNWCDIRYLWNLFEFGFYSDITNSAFNRLVVSQVLSSTILLFLFGVWGLLVMRTNVVNILLAIELLFIGVSFNFILFSIYLDDIIGQIVTLILMTLAASESAIGLALFLGYQRQGHHLAISGLNILKG